MSSDESTIEFRALGPLRIVTASGLHILGRNQRSSILADLVCKLDQQVSFDVLAHELRTSRINVMKAKSKLANDLAACGVEPDRVLVTGNDGYLLRSTGLVVDTTAFTRDVEEAERILESDSSTALRLSSTALGMWDTPFQGVNPTLTVDEECVRLEGLHRRAQLARFAALLATGQAHVVETEVRTLLHRDRDDEAVCYYLVVALGHLGRQSEALDEIKALNDVRALRGTEPSPALMAVHDELVRGEVAFVPRRVVAGARPRPRPVRPPLRLQLTGNSVHVGNQEQLGLLGSLSERIKGAGSAVCYVEGRAGMGKTRLVEEWAAAPTSGGFWQCWLGFRERDDGPFRRMSQMIGETLNLGSYEHAETEELVNEVIDERLIQAMFRQAEQQPLLVIVEDVHWADERCVGFLARLASAINRQSHDDNACILLVVTARPATSDGSVTQLLDQLRRGRGVTQLTVGPLSDLEVHELVRELGVPNPAMSLIRTVQTVAAGNPLAIRALVSQLERIGALVNDQGTTVIDRADDELPTDADIDTLVRQRLDTFSDEGRQVLIVIAILGDHASLPLIHHLTGDPDLVDVALEEGVQAGVLLDGGDTIRFDHPTTSQASLVGVRPRQLRSMHAKAAEYLIENHSGDDAAVTWIADHLIRSGERADMGQLAHYGTMAGQVAMSVAAWSDADRYLEAALEGAETLQQPAKLLAQSRLQAATAAFRDHQIGRAVSLFTAVADYGRQAQDYEFWGQGVVQRARCLVHDVRALDSEAEVGRLQEFLQTADLVDEVRPALRASAHQLLSTLAWGEQDYTTSAVHAQKALDIASLDQDLPLVGHASLQLGLAQQGLLQLHQAVRSFGRATRATAQSSANIFQDWGKSRSAVSLWMLGELDAAFRAASDAAAAAEEASNWAEACLAWTIVAGVEQAQGDTSQALMHAETAQRLYHRSSFYWAATLLLPVRMSLAADLADDSWLSDIVRDWKRQRLLPHHLEALLALSQNHRPEMIRCAHQLQRYPIQQMSMAKLPGVVVGAELAVALDDRDLAKWSLDLLQAQAADQVVVAPGINRLVLAARGRSHAVLGNEQAAMALLEEALEQATKIGMPNERNTVQKEIEHLRSGNGPAQTLTPSS